jgi:hypothetical protein
MALIDDVHQRLNAYYDVRLRGSPYRRGAPGYAQRVEDQGVLALMEVLVEEIERLERVLAHLGTRVGAV